MCERLKEMKLDDKIKRAESLIEEINYHDRLYFTENRQEISDSAYDELWFELKDLLSDEDVRKASNKMKMPLGEQTSFLDKVSHSVPILSLDKIKSSDNSFEKNIRKFEKNYNTGHGYLIESKLDGLTVVMYKQNGSVVFATRGGSTKGENVTEQVTLLEDVKLASEKSPDAIIVRGEAIIPKENFFKSDKYSNARNAVSGALRSKEIGSFASVRPEYVAYDILSHHSKNEVEDLELLDKLGFRTVKSRIVKPEEDLYEVVKDIIHSDWRDQERYEIDGLVIKPISKSKIDYDGDGHHAKGQIAVKFPPKGDFSYLRDVEFTIGKNGQMTPVAVYDEIEIDGVKMSRASMGSWNNFLDLNLKKGDKIYVVRSNDVIPQIDAVLERYEDSEEVEQPKDSWIEGAHLYTAVSKPVEEKFAHFAKSLNIKAFNAKTWKILLENRLIERYVDIFDLKNKRNEMLLIKGLGEKKVDLMIEEIELSRRSSFEQLLNAMQYQALGSKMCKDIAKNFSSLEDFLNTNIEEVVSKVKSLNAPAKSTISELLDNVNLQKDIIEVSDNMK